MSLRSDFIISIGKGDHERPSGRQFSWFNLWKIKKAPYTELLTDSLLYWYDPRKEEIFLKSRVVAVERIQYTTKEEVREWLRQNYGRDPGIDPYFSKRAIGGKYCLAFKV